MGASDLHLKVGRAPTVRVDGSLESLAGPALSADDVSRSRTHCMPEWRREQFAVGARSTSPTRCPGSVGSG